MNPTYRRADVALAGLIVLLTLITVVVTVPAVAPATVNDRLDMAILTASTLVAGAVAALDWARARVAHEPADVLRASAFAVLAVLNGATLAVGLAGADERIGASLSDPGQLPVMAGIVARGMAVLLLVAGGAAALSRRTPRLPTRFVLVGPAVAVALFFVAGTVAGDSLPQLVPEAALESLAADPTAPLALTANPVLVALQSAIGAGFLVAAILAHRSYRRSGRGGDLLLAAGFVIAAFSQAHSAIHPGSYATVVTSADMLRLAFYGTLLVGIVAESRDDLADLRAATLEVRRLAEAEFAAVALEERARLAREIHDGLAQDLWYAKLKQSRLAQLAGYDDEAQQLSDEVGDAIDAALAEARHAVSAMQGGSQVGPLLEILRRQVEDFSDRFALRAELVTGELAVPDIGPRGQAEVIRIVQEALTNVRKHADATVVKVNVGCDEGEISIGVVDNGRGFAVDATQGGFGLESMRQRADVIGARLSVTSAPQDGTRVQLVVPVRGKEGSRAR